MDDCKGVCYELATQDSEERLAHDIGCSLPDLLGRAYAALTFTLAVVVAFGAFLPRALAANQYKPEMVINGNLVDGTREGYMCVNCNQFTATLELIGKMGEYITITSDKYDSLVASAGFHDAMERWQELTSDATADMQNSWLGGDSFVDGWLILSGQGNCWYGIFSEDEIQEALESYESVMDDSGGSGGSGGSGEVPSTVPLYYTGNGNDVYGNVIACELSDSAKATIESFADGHSWYITFVQTDSAGACWVWEVGTTDCELLFENDRLLGLKNNSSSSVGNDNWTTAVSFDSSSKVLSLSALGFPYGHPVGSGAVYGLGNIVYCSKLNGEGGGSGGGSGGGTDDPDEPVEPDEPGPSPTAPEPPDLPDIGDPTVPHEPDPTPPTTEPTPPTLPTPITVTVPTDTSPNDYTPWLRAILEELKNINAALNSYLQSIIDEMAEHCQHIRDEMGTQATYLGECLDSVANAAAGVGDQLENALHDYAEWLAEYFDQWGEWLVAHLDFNNEVTIDPYDDTSLLYWLKRIYTKLGGSNNPVNTRPTDPVTNPVETGNWLEELWNEILKNLAQLFPNLMIDLGLIFDDLKSKFPFSIPWDIHALMLLLVTEPVAPHFTVPMYAISTSYELEVVGEYDIDLSVYTDYLMGVHLMLEIAWIGYMLNHTRDYMELIEAVIPS